MSPDSTRATVGSGPVWPICSAFSGSSANSSRFSRSSSEISGHGSTLRTAEIQVLSERRCVSVNFMTPTAYAPKGLTIRTAEDADWPAMALLAATCFGALAAGGNERHVADDDACRQRRRRVRRRRTSSGWRSYLDLKLTVPGGAVLPMAGLSWVAVSPTHRRRGALRAMFAELHGRMGDYPIAGLQASEAGIYGRFGYGPAMVEHKLTVDRREARFLADVPDPGGVRIVEAAAHREQLADI